MIGRRPTSAMSAKVKTLSRRIERCGAHRDLIVFMVLQRVLGIGEIRFAAHRSWFTEGLPCIMTPVLTHHEDLIWRMEASWLELCKPSITILGQWNRGTEQAAGRVEASRVPAPPHRNNCALGKSPSDWSCSALSSNWSSP